MEIFCMSYLSKQIATEIHCLFRYIRLAQYVIQGQILVGAKRMSNR